MKILVTGKNGQLGSDVLDELKNRQVKNNLADGDIIIGVGREDFDLENSEPLIGYITELRPDVIIHCAAYTAVEKAEIEHNKCRLINVTSTKNIARACKTINCKMVYISSDYVFSGEGSKPYEVYDAAYPINIYGQSKWEGENEVKRQLDEHFIIRISWVYGQYGNNFVKSMLKLASTPDLPTGKKRSEIRVVNDQVGSPTYTKDLARLIADMIVTDKFGTYHATNEGYCSWAEFAQEIFNFTNTIISVKPISTDEFQTKARRPKNSRLSKRSLDIAGFSRLPDWKDALRRFLINELIH